MPRQSVPEVIFEDDHLIAINKPAGLLSIPGRDSNQSSTLDILRGQFRELFVVHRLDRDTSGVLIFAKDAEAHRRLSLQFSNRRVTKIYLAVVAGRPPEETFTIDRRLAIDGHGRAIVSSTGKSAKTQCRVLEIFHRYSFLEVRPFTGRQHQIRAHLAHQGYPLAVDPIYGSPEPITILNIKPSLRKGHLGDAGLSNLMARTPLHAWSALLEHPMDGGHLRIQAELPKDMQALLRQLRKWS